MDKSKAAHEHDLRNNKKILLAEHNLLVWGTQTVNSGQRNVQRILPADQHEGCLRISISPTIKLSSRKSQLFDFSSNEENIGGREKRKMGGGHANGSVEP
jgi:hypothetical protein